jgi:hypothetical protein
MIIRSTEGRSHETSGGRERMRCPRAGLVTPHPGGPGQPSAGTKTGCLQWLDVAGTKGGGSRPDQGREERSVLRREARRRGQKSRRGAPRGATPWQQGVHRRTGSAFSARHPLSCEEGKQAKGNTGDPGARQTIRAITRVQTVPRALHGPARRSPQGRRRAPAKQHGRFRMSASLQKCRRSGLLAGQQDT